MYLEKVCEIYGLSYFLDVLPFRKELGYVLKGLLE